MAGAFRKVNGTSVLVTGERQVLACSVEGSPVHHEDGMFLGGQSEAGGLGGLGACAVKCFVR